MPNLDNSAEVNTSSFTKGKRLALVAGVNNSEKLNSRETLQYADQDASDMAAALSGSACKFTLIEPTIRGKEATTENIRRAIIKLVEGRTEEDFLVFYFSGHAQAMELPGGHKDIYLVTSDFKESDLKFGAMMHLSMRWLRETLYEQTEAGAVLIILDCCYAGNFINAGTDPFHIDLGSLIENWMDEPPFPTRKNAPRVTLTATGYNVTAQERDGHGRMTKFLLEALHDEHMVVEVDENGYVDVHAIHRHLKKNIPEQLPDLAGIFGSHHWILAYYPARSARNRKDTEEEAILRKIESVLRVETTIDIHAQPFDSTLCWKASFADLDEKSLAEFFKQERVQKSIVCPPTRRPAIN